MRARYGFLLAVFALSVAGCGGGSGDSDSHGAGTGGAGTGGIGGGGAGGVPTGGTGGMSTGGQGGEGGSGGTAGSGQWGTGGFSSDPSVWRAVHVEGEWEKEQLMEGDVSKLPFEPLKWEANCGSHCESAVLAPEANVMALNAVLGAVRDEEGVSVYAASRQGVPDPPLGAVLWRGIRLSDGRTVGALRLQPLVSYAYESPGLFFIGPSPSYVVVLSNHRFLRGSFHAPSRTWEWKTPFTDSIWGGFWCTRFDVDTTPPALIDACPAGVMVRDRPGTIDGELVPDSRYSYIASGFGGMAVWSQLPNDSSSSGVWGWTPERGVWKVAEIPGNVCSLSLTDDRLVGVRGGPPERGGLCDDSLESPQIFVMPREGGGRIDSPPFSKPFKIDIRAYGDYAAAFASKYVEKGSEHHVLLIRLTDWKIRRFHPRPERYVSSLDAIAVDGTHFYYVDEIMKPGEYPLVDRVYRYPLSAFDSIGEPFDPWETEPPAP